MRRELDGNVPLAVAGVLRAAGHDVHTVFDEALAGTSRAQLLATCRQEGRALLTLDLDFADLRSYPPEATAGLVVLRPGSQDVPLPVRSI
jgi:predicted nuclease of predicted toxin-antitoxin system